MLEILFVLAVLFFIGLYSAEKTHPGTLKKFQHFAEQRRDYHNKRVKDALDRLTDNR